MNEPGEITDAEHTRKYQEQARMLANRVKKRFQHLSKRFARQNIEVFRLYDWDIPEIRAVVDWYGGHLVIGEYMRKQSTPQWLPLMAEASAAALGVPREKVHLKERIAGRQDGRRYSRLDHTEKKIVLNERDLRFYINPYDFVDTGLFADHRNTRAMVREMAVGKDFLNLYCYTGAFTCYAARGGARLTVSVDRSRMAINWARDNLTLNGLSLAQNELVQFPTLVFLKKASYEKRRFDLAVVDPPSFSTARAGGRDFDVAGDHPVLLEAVLKVMRPGAVIFFSTNHQNFQPRMESLKVSHVEEITSQTIPEDYVHKRKTIHRCWRIAV
ncbi:MAG: class I SAM-dependent methyltransferase [Desulfosarcinaceae bacterium]